MDEGEPSVFSRETMNLGYAHELQVLTKAKTKLKLLNAFQVLVKTFSNTSCSIFSQFLTCIYCNALQLFVRARGGDVSNAALMSAEWKRLEQSKKDAFFLQVHTTHVKALVRNDCYGAVH